MSISNLSLLFITSLILLSSGCTHSFQNTGAKVDDSVITGKARYVLLEDPSVHSRNLRVSTHEGNVTISGVVDDAVEKHNAIDDVKNIPGVKSVDSRNLFVKRSKSLMKDAAITAQLRAKILSQRIFSDKHFGHWPIQIHTKDGVVVLSGKVKNASTRNEIVHIAKSIKQVKSVSYGNLTII